MQISLWAPLTCKPARHTQKELQTQIMFATDYLYIYCLPFPLHFTMAMLKILVIFLALVRAKSLLNTSQSLLLKEKQVGNQSFFLQYFNSNSPSSSFLLCLLDYANCSSCLPQSFCIFYSSSPSAGLTNYLHPLFCAGCKMVITPLSEK